VQSFCSRASFNSKGYFIAEYAGQMAGFLALEREPWGEAGSQFGYIYQIGIASDFRRKNLASLLMLEARNFARQAGIQKLGVGVKNSNRAALEFFKKHGFQCVFSSQGFQIQIT
ncbi:MAG: GNAT family N-acetyltransferase, partial [Candidatus Omnitrophica bacterium]|nr:GNAT family N-acetyltransferase [Candidatus Omnitrophota bacterium]